MQSIIDIMLPAFVACLVLTGIHTYLGLHVVSRGVIFVDLALAQIAALGSTFAFLLGFDPKSPAGYAYSLGFTFLGAAIFSLSRLKDNRIPQEALIGITFAVASATTILIADRAPQGAEHIQEMLAGAILWVRWPTIWKTLFIYSIVGLFHYRFRKKFLLISMDPREAERRGIAVNWWDFLFYMSFGFVITSSVAIAGVLLVFSFLIIPSVIGMLYSHRIETRLIIGWISGTLVSLAGLYLSYTLDLPSGPAVVSTFGVVLVLSALLHYLLSSRHKLKALGRMAAASAALGGLVVLAFLFRPSGAGPGPGEIEAAQRVTEAVRILSTVDHPDDSAVQRLVDHAETLQKMVKRRQVKLEQRILEHIADSGRTEFIPVLAEAFAATHDPWLQYYSALGQVRLGDPEGIHHMVNLLNTEGPVFLRTLVIAKVKELTRHDFGYDPMREPASNQKAINAAEVWWHQNTDRFVWDAESRQFSLE